jgi:hypothetical protein
MCAFYGWTPSVVESLSLSEFYSYQKAIVVLECNRQLKAMQVSDYPHIKDDARKRVFKSIQKQVESLMEKPKSTSSNKLLSNEELMRMIAGR